MKRYFVLLLCVFAVVGLLLACASTQEASKTKPAKTYEPSEKSKPKVDILSHSATVSYGRYVVTGEVQNNGGRAVQSVRINATFYDANKKVVDMGFTYTDPMNLEPSQKAPFEVINHKEEMTPAISSYELQVVVY